VISEAYKEKATTRYTIKQGFLSTHPMRTVRIRIKEGIGYLTIKGKSDKAGISRFEWEKEISAENAQELLYLCEEGLLEKIRYEIIVGNHTFEVDEFFGLNKGLVVAEVELNHENESFEKPSWLGKEVTGEIKYYNSQLSKQPYSTWKQ